MVGEGGGAEPAHGESRQAEALGNVTQESSSRTEPYA